MCVCSNIAYLKLVSVPINICHHPYSKDPLRTVRPENFAGNRPGTESGTGTGTGESLVSERVTAGRPIRLCLFARRRNSQILTPKRKKGPSAYEMGPKHVSPHLMSRVKNEQRR